MSIAALGILVLRMAPHIFRDELIEANRRICDWTTSHATYL